MERFTQAAKILIDQEFLSVSEELRKLKKHTDTPRVKYKNKTQWRSVCEDSMDALAHGLASYIEKNLLSGTSIEETGGIPMVLPKFELEIDAQLCTCLEQITQNKPWSARRAKEISLGIGTSLASFGRGIGLREGERISQSILDYVMTFVMCAIKTSSPCGDSIDAIPMVPCDCCGEDMPLYWKSRDFATQSWSWRILDICDDCELVQQGV